MPCAKDYARDPFGLERTRVTRFATCYEECDGGGLAMLQYKLHAGVRTSDHKARIACALVATVTAVAKAEHWAISVRRPERQTPRF